MGAENAEARVDRLVGTVIQDRFLVVERIAAGGMGVVYKAEQVPLGRPVALKILESKHNEQVDSHFSERFFLEAAAVAKLSHPNTIVLYDYGRTQDELYYYAMEYVEGTTLTRRIFDHGPLSPAQAIHVALQIGGSLRDAHGHGMVHRDLKPGNVMLTEKGGDELFVKVLDFGLVKVMGQDVGVELTKSGMLMGSPRYMAPEQVTGRAVDRRADVYSLGTVLYHALTGAPPFQQESQYEVLRAQVEVAPPPLTATYPGCTASPRLEAFVMRCLEKRREQRPQDMNEVLAELAECAREAGVEDMAISSSCRPLTASQEAASLSTSMEALIPEPNPTIAQPIARRKAAAAAEAEASGEAASEPSSGIGRTLALIAVVLGAGLLAAVLAFMVPQGGSEEGESEEPAPAEQEALGQEPVHLDSAPAGARVRRGDADLGDTPVTLTIPEGERWDVTLSLEGYEDRTITLSSGRGAIDVRLRRIPAPTAEPTPTPEPEVEPVEAEPERATGRGRRRGAATARAGRGGADEGAETAGAPDGTGSTSEPESDTTSGSTSESWGRRSSDNRDPWAQ